jgi:hypothetical protein
VREGMRRRLRGASGRLGIAALAGSRIGTLTRPTTFILRHPLGARLHWGYLAYLLNVQVRHGYRAERPNLSIQRSFATSSGSIGESLVSEALPDSLYYFDAGGGFGSGCVTRSNTVTPSVSISMRSNRFGISVDKVALNTFPLSNVTQSVPK